MSVDKSGGEATNFGAQGADSNADLTNVAPGGAGILGGFGGHGFAMGSAESEVEQALRQAGYGGDGGDDNIEANTTINIG